MNAKELHQRAVELVGRYKRVEAELIELLSVMDQKKSFMELGYGSLYLYATSGLGLSENVAYSLITVARKSVAVPALKAEIKAGKLNVSHAKRIAPILNAENQSQWIEKASSLSLRELERELAREFPKTEVKERAAYINAERIELKIGISHEMLEELKLVQDLESQRQGRAVSLEETLGGLLALYKERKDPLEKARKLVAKRVEPESSASNLKRAIPSSTRQVIWLRDQARCTARNPDGSRCQARRWIDMHHLIPCARGGGNGPKNIVLLCRAHHRALHGRESSQSEKGSSQRGLGLGVSA